MKFSTNLANFSNLLEICIFILLKVESYLRKGMNKLDLYVVKLYG